VLTGTLQRLTKSVSAKSESGVNASTRSLSGYEGLCRDNVVTGLLGGSPAEVPQRYAQASPSRLLPLGVPHALVIGEHEDFVPRPLMEAYAAAASKTGDSVRLLVLPGADHFQIASPLAPTWSSVGALIRSLLDGNLGSSGR
jgi:pimeloyl-ACP methyl ester carboxylesterase